MRRSFLQRMKRGQCRCWETPAAGWTSIFQAGSRTLLRNSILSAPISDRRCGRCCCRSPYGQTTTYGALAKQLAEKNGGKRVSAQAVGGAVGHNPVSIIVPCHRVVGSDGSLTGYAGGIEKKMRLLMLENAEAANLYR